MDNVDISFLSWLIPSLLSIMAIWRAFYSDKRTANQHDDDSNVEQAIMLRDRYKEDVETLTKLIEKSNKERMELLDQHTTEMNELRADYEELKEKAQEAFSEIGKMNIEFKKMKKTYDELSKSWWRMYDILEENNIMHSEKPIVERVYNG